jgi:radical SAM protein with 4Fe4S-binding SPASM domain
MSEALKKWNMAGRISLTGGEPFLDDDLFYILEALESQKEFAQINVLSNGTLITPSLANKLSKLNKLHEVQISLDGATREIHEKLRGSGSFDRALAGIDYLKDYNIPVTIMYTLWKGNICDVPAMVDLAIAKQISAFTVERVVPCGNGQQLRDDILLPRELKNVYEYLSSRANTSEFIRSGVRLRRSRPLWVNTTVQEIDGKYKGVGGFCPVGYTSLAILHDGTVLPCRRLEIPIGNILRDGLYKIWYTSDLLWRIRDKRNLKGKCKECPYIPYCGGCRAIAYYLTGDYMGEDAQCWK